MNKKCKLTRRKHSLHDMNSYSSSGQFYFNLFSNAVFVSLFRKFVLYLRRKKVAPVFYISIQ